MEFHSAVDTPWGIGIVIGHAKIIQITISRKLLQYCDDSIVQSNLHLGSSWRAFYGYQDNVTYPTEEKSHNSKSYLFFVKTERMEES